MSKQPTEAELKGLRTTLHKFNLSNGQTVHYSLADKDSNSGLFTNERLVLFHTGEGSLRYYTKPPKGIPFTQQSDIVEGKDKVFLKSVHNVKCEAVKGKVSTWSIQWDAIGVRKQWIFIMKASQLMTDWLTLINDYLTKQKPNQFSNLQQKNIQNNQQLNSKKQQILPPPKQETNQSELKPISNYNVQVNQSNKFNTQPPPNKPYYDISSEIKYLRNDNANRFNLTNQLSQKKLPQNTNLTEQNHRNDPQQQIKMSFAKNKQQQYKKQEPQFILSQNPTKSKKNINNQFIQSSANQSYQNSRFKQLPINKSAHLGLSKNSSNGEYNRKGPPNLPPLRKWNEQWCQYEVQEKLYLYDDFVMVSKSLLVQIVDELPFYKKDRQYAPIQSNPPYYIFRYSGIIIIIHYDSKTKQQPTEYNENAPLIYNDETYEDLKRQFNNYDLIIRATKNQGYIKVPLTCYFQYKGILGLCKAEIPSNFQNVKQVKGLGEQIVALESLIKCKIPLGQMSVHVHPGKKYLIINDIIHLIPKIPNHIPSTFTKEYLLNEQQQILQERNSIRDAHYNVLRNNLPQFVEKYQALQLWIINTTELNQQLQKSGLNHSFIPDIIQQSKSVHLRKILASEVIASIFVNIMRSQINNLFSSFPINQISSHGMGSIDSIILDGVHVLINQLFSYTLKAENIWKVIVNEVNKKYRIIVSKEDVIVGFLLSSVIIKLGLNCRFKDSSFNKNVEFFVKQNTIPRDLLDKFIVLTHRYPSTSISPPIAQISDIIHQQNSTHNFQAVVKLLNLRKNKIPQILCQVKSDVISYLTNFIPFDDEGQFLHLNLYQDLQKQPHTKLSLRVSMLAIKWTVKHRNIELATKIFQIKCQENSFWLGEFNPPIGQFYDFFSMYYASTGNYDESIKLAKSSLVNAIKVLGTTSLPIADKHYQLGNIYFKITQKQQALKQYTKTQQILHAHSQTTIPQYGIILLKMSLLYLNFGKIKDCVVHSLEAVKIFDQNGSNEQDQIQTFQILARAYQITRKPNDMMNVGAMCSEKFNLTQDAKIFERMVKIVMYPKMSLLNSQQSKSLQGLLFKLQELDSPATYLEAFSFFHRKASSINVMKKVLSLIDNVISLNQEALKKDLFRKHKSLNLDSKSQAQQLLVMVEAVCIMVGYGFLLGSLKQNYYD